MSANISFVNGRAEFASALRPAWWDAASEYVLPEVPTSADMITAAHLDWTVELSRCRDESGKALADYCFTRRADRQTLPSIKGSWWSLYNAVSEAVDHGNIFRSTGKGVERAERKFANVAFGNGADFKQQAFDLALSMAV